MVGLGRSKSIRGLGLDREGSESEGDIDEGLLAARTAPDLLHGWTLHGRIESVVGIFL